jgi:hypothetical protein
MGEVRQFFGALLAMIGLALLVSPLFLLREAEGAANRIEVAPLLEALAAIAGGVLILILSWILLRRR